MKNSTTRRKVPKLQILNFLPKFLTERKYLIRPLTFARRKHKHKIIKTINSAHLMLALSLEFSSFLLKPYNYPILGSSEIISSVRQNNLGKNIHIHMNNMLICQSIKITV